MRTAESQRARSCAEILVSLRALRFYGGFARKKPRSRGDGEFRGDMGFFACLALPLRLCVREIFVAFNCIQSTLQKPVNFIYTLV